MKTPLFLLALLSSATTFGQATISSATLSGATIGGSTAAVACTTAADTVSVDTSFPQVYGSVDNTGSSGSFTSGSGGSYPYTACAVAVFIQRAGTVDVGHQIYAEIRSDSSGLPGTLLATSASYDIGSLPTTAANFTFTFSSGASIAASTKYHVCTVITTGDSHGNVINNYGTPSSGNTIGTRSSGAVWSSAAADWTEGFTLYHQ